MSEPTKRHAGRTVFITGIARGQGRAEAVRFAEEGANIIGIDICTGFATVGYPGATVEDLDETIALVEKAGGSILAERVDVRDADGVQATVARGVETFGGLDVVVANAGIFAAAWSWETSAELWNDIIGVNLTGVHNTARATVPILIEQGRGGAIIFTSSLAGGKGIPYGGAYAASKAGVVGLARTMANELGTHNIRVNTIHPHAVATPMIPGNLADYLTHPSAENLASIYMTALPDAVAQPEDVARVVTWLASDDARQITGVQLPIDFGALNR